MPQKYRQHKIYPKKFPESWASGWGEDEYGIWMEFTYRGVIQRFRWCEPGTFLMGSPEDEPERLDNEVQHKTKFTQGFWIADTTVTQDLWEKVMGNNPSRFYGKERPVERVSWDDAQAFIDRMNFLKSELEVSLPSEAQWEYACRTGSNTPFFWGEQISSDLVNFNGEYPYHFGEASQDWEETIEVQFFSPNDWGLWQMHGNVWEWCDDWYSPGYPTQSESANRRILRGGSWVDSGGGCRSAFRNNLSPISRSGSIGFRLVLRY